MLKPSLQLRIGQQLTMTPQLQQAIRLLQLPVLELDAQLQEALDTNLMLELDEADAESAGSVLPESAGFGESAAETPGGDADTGTDAASDFEYDPDESGVLPDDVPPPEESWSEVAAATTSGDPWSSDDDRQAAIADKSGQSLREHLLWQLGLEHFSVRETVIGTTLIDYISDDGYLTESCENILGMLDPAAGFTLVEVEQTLARVQGFDPAGVGARNLAECLRLQLAQLAVDVPGRELALAIAAAHLDLVAARELTMLRRKLNASEADVAEALALLKTCHPRPGSALQMAEPQYVVPDVFVRKHDGRWVVEVNGSLAPRLRVNQAYAQMLRGTGSEHTALRTQLQEARWLVRSLDIRNDTLLKVARCIVRRQQDFFEQGEEHMKPMVLRDIAETVEMHESTISRITSGKYMHTPRGVFELRYFFSSQVTGEDGTEQSSTAIRAKIRKLIGQENPDSPLSDSRIAELLQTDGANVARRTVAKYREAMKIAPSSERRRRAAR